MSAGADRVAAAPAGGKPAVVRRELRPEANTPRPKSATTVLSGPGLAPKAVLEQLREQVQNVE